MINLSVKETQNNTKEILAEQQRKALQFVAEGGEIIRGEMVMRCITGKIAGGNLKNSIKTESYVEDGMPTSETGPEAKYAVYVEYGTGIHASPEGTGSKAKKIPWSYQDERGDWHTTSGMEAKPFAEPGFQAAQPKIKALSERIMKL